jgi:hypothetical protein
VTCDTATIIGGVTVAGCVGCTDGTISGVTNAASLEMAIGSAVLSVAVDGLAWLQACKNMAASINNNGIIFFMFISSFPEYRIMSLIINS